MTKFGYLIFCPCLDSGFNYTERPSRQSVEIYYNASICEIMLYLSLGALVGRGQLFEFFAGELAPSSDDMGRGRCPIPVGC